MDVVRQAARFGVAVQLWGLDSLFRESFSASDDLQRVSSLRDEAQVSDLSRL